MNPYIIILVLTLTSPIVAAAQAKKLTPAEVPTFQIRARVISQAGKKPDGKRFTFRLNAPSKPSTAKDDAWSDWLPFGRKQVEANLKGYPAIYMRGYPVVVRLVVSGVVDPTRIEAELKFDENGKTIKMNGELFGPRLGILIWRDGKEPQAATMAVYNRRYWKVLEGVRIPVSQRPKRFPIVDRFIGGDDDRIAWKEGITQLSRAGFSVLMLPPSQPIRKLLLETGLKRTSWAVYSPPGYAFDFDPKITPDSIQQWADKIADQYLKAGYDRKDMALFAMSDEPGWYYPQMFDKLVKSNEGIKRFHAYLKEQKLSLGDLGKKTWADVTPVGRNDAMDLPSRRLFYWTMRFFAYDSSRHFATSTRALEKAFYPGLPVLTNWNFFAGRLYVPGPVANNRDKKNSNAAMGGHDWFEFGRQRGGTMLWTEDWFPDRMAYQWSFYCAKLRCAAEKSGVEFGGYVIPRTAGERVDGILQRILCIVGSGGKAVKYFVFGPEYNFPGNCYSERAKVLPKMAEAHGMIGAAEELLWAGKRPPPQVAILAPRSSQLWDAKDIPIPRQIRDATNNNMNGSTVDYMAEVFNLYLALQHANIPVDFVDEDDLTVKGLKPYRVLYVTEPNVPVNGQHGIADWVKQGGTLVTVSGAASRDRYDETASVLSDALGIHEKPRMRLLVANTKSLKAVATGKGKHGPFTAVGVRGDFAKSDGDVLAKFDDGSPAVMQRRVGNGRAIHFAWMPGMSYWNSSTETRDKLPIDFSESLRRWILFPTELANVQTPVEVSELMIETPILLSKAGAAVTLLNWTGADVKNLSVKIRVPFRVTSVQSVGRGRPIEFRSMPNGVTFQMPLGAADIVMLR